MLNDQAFQDDGLISELRSAGIVVQTTGDVDPPVGFAVVNHDPNNNVRVQITPHKKIPVIPEYNKQNPTIYLDENRGELGFCLKHANQFIISCDGATSGLHLLSSFGQTIVDLTNNNANRVDIHINGVKYTSNDYIAYIGDTRVFNYDIFIPYGINHTEIMGNYKLFLLGMNQALLEVRVVPAVTPSTLTVENVSLVFPESPMDPNPTLTYYANEEFYGFYVCMQSESLPSTTYIDYARIETMDILLAAGFITSYNNEAIILTIDKIVDGEHSSLTATFASRMRSLYEDVHELRKHDYLLVLEVKGIDPSTINKNKIVASYNKYKTIDGVDELLEENVSIPNDEIYFVNGQFVHPMTLDESYDGVFYNFDIDFDGVGDMFTPAQHRLDIKVIVNEDIYIPLYSLERQTVTVEINTEDLPYVLYDRWQWYEFPITVGKESVFYLEAVGMTDDNVTIEVPIIDHPDNIRQVPTMYNKGTDIAMITGDQDVENTFLVRIKVPAGQYVIIKLYELNYGGHEINATRDEYGNITTDSNVIKPWYDPSVDEAYLGNTSRISYINGLAMGAAIAVDSGFVYLSQNAKNSMDFVAEKPDWMVGEGGLADIYIETYKNEVSVFSLVEGGVNVHSYSTTPSNFVIEYLGTRFVPWAYDTTKTVSVRAQGNAVGTPYLVDDANDFGPIGIDNLVGMATAVSITNIEEL